MCVSRQCRGVAPAAVSSIPPTAVVPGELQQASVFDQVDPSSDVQQVTALLAASTFGDQSPVQHSAPIPVPGASATQPAADELPVPDMDATSKVVEGGGMGGALSDCIIS